MWKVKHERTADCVVAGFRWHKDGEGVGSLLLGLFDDEGTLHHVGVASSFTAARRKELVDELAPLREDALADHPWREWAEAGRPTRTAAMPGGLSRWNAQKDLSLGAAAGRAGGRGALRARAGAAASATAAASSGSGPTATPESCTYGQLEEVAPAELSAIFPEA